MDNTPHAYTENMVAMVIGPPTVDGLEKCIADTWAALSELVELSKMLETPEFQRGLQAALEILLKHLP